MAFPDGWGRKCKITIPAAKIAGSNVNFPLLLTGANLPAEMLDGGANSALNGGGDIRFSEDVAGLSPLAAEIVTLVTGALPTAEIWLKLPTLNTGAAKDIYVWYNKAGETQPLVTDPLGRNAVWAAERLVCHMESTSPVDSSGNAVLTANALTAASGPYGGALDFNGVSSDIDCGAALLPAGDFTATALIKPDSTSGFNGLIGNWSSADKATGYMGIVSGKAAINDYGANSGTSSGVATLSTGVWYRITAVRSGADWRIYINGALDAEFLGLNLSAPSVSYNTWIGALTAGTQYFYDGLIADIRLSDVANSADRELTEYTNQSDPATFAIAGMPEAAAGAALVIQAAAQGLTSTSISLAQFQDLVISGAGQGHAVDSPALLHLQDLVIANAACGLGSGNVTIYEPSPYSPAAGRTDSPARATRTISPNSTRTIRI